jgi:hypothetical protein
MKSIKYINCIIEKMIKLINNSILIQQQSIPFLPAVVKYF